MVLEQQRGFLNQRWGGYDFLKFLSLNYLNLCFVITQYHGRSLSIEVDSTISPNIAIIQ